MPTFPAVTFHPESQAQYQAVLRLAETWLSGAGHHDHGAAPPGTLPDGAAPAYTLQQVRARLTELSRAGKADAVKALLKQHGATNVTELDPAHYAAVLAAGGAL